MSIHGRADFVAFMSLSIASPLKKVIGPLNFVTFNVYSFFTSSVQILWPHIALKRSNSDFIITIQAII